jgi:glycerophosphoryl diester phosphodiesterase
MTRELWRGAPLGPLLSSFSVDALAAARAVAPELPRGYLVDKIPGDWRDTMKRLACVAFHCNHKSLTEKLAAEIHGAGYSILLWTVNEPSDAQRLLKMGADCLVTDALDRIGPDFQ